MILEVISALAGGGVLGGLTGLVGSIVTKWDESRKRDADYRIELLRAEQTRELVKLDQAHALALAGLNAASQERLADINAQARADESASADYRAAIDADKATYSTPGAQESSRLVRWMMGVVDFLRGIIRPGITIYSMVLLTILMLWVQSMYQSKALSLTTEQTQKLALDIIGTVTYLASTTVTFWFGVRPSGKK
jgi:hypothetical protein